MPIYKFNFIITILFVGILFIIAFKTDWIIKKAKVKSGEALELQAELDAVRNHVRNLRALLEEMSCKSNGIGARGGFCLQTDKINVGYNYLWDDALCKLLENGLFKDQRVGDFGAGLGWYGMFWTRKTKPSFNYGRDEEEKHFFNVTSVTQHMQTPQMVKAYQGFDGAGNVELVTNGFIQYLDLTEVQNLGVKFDWVFSLEVGEHIPAVFETTFIENVINHACKGVIISWARIGQGGHFHVNNHDNDYVKKRFSEYGFENLLEEETRLRNNVNLKYLANTIMVFQRKAPLKHHQCDN